MRRLSKISLLILGFSVICAGAARADGTLSRCDSALTTAAIKNDIVAAQKLLQGGISPNCIDDSKHTPLSWVVAPCVGDPKSCPFQSVDQRLVFSKLLFSYGAAETINIQEKRQGRSPLMTACSYSGQSHALAELFLAKGALPSLLDKSGQSALHHAAAWTDSVTVADLIGAGADINLKDTDAQWTPLHWAVAGEQLNNVKTLIAAKADLDAVDKNGTTALMYASMLNWTEASGFITSLLDAGAQVNARDNAGQTALSYAESVNNQLAIVLLQSRGATH